MLPFARNDCKYFCPITYPSELQDLLLPNSDDADDLAAKLQKWRKDKQYYNKLVFSISEELRDYTWDHIAKSILDKME